MGVIKRQGIKAGIIGYIGIIVGFIGTVWVYPLDFELYGYIQSILASATLLTPILRLGSVPLITKFFTRYHDEGNKGFLTGILLVTSATMLVTTGMLFVLSWFLESFSINTEILNFIDFRDDRFYVIYIVTILLVFSNVFQTNASNYLRVVVPEIIQGLGLKVMLFCVVLSGYFLGVELGTTVLILFTYLVLNLLLMIVYNYRIGALNLSGFKLSKISKALYLSAGSYWVFAGLNYLGNIIAFKIDIIMLESMIGYKEVGFYSVILFMTIIIQVPLRAILNIASPVISKSLQRNDYDNVIQIYSKSSLNLLIVGVLLFSLVYINFTSLTEIMTNGELIKPYLNVFLFIGLARLFDVSTSVNNLIIVYSRWYKYNLLLLLFTGIINISLNFVFIEKYGILGAGMATAISLLILNIAKTVVVYLFINYQPFSWKMLIPAGVLVMVIFLPYSAGTDSTLLNITINSTILAVVYLPLIYFSKISPDLNLVAQNTLKKLANYMK
jgi:O-antigen/teichoic acid export membrane protein